MAASVSRRGGGADAGYDAGSAEQDEAAQDHHRAMTPVDPAGQHAEADSRDRDHRDDGGYSAQQRALHPVHRRDQHAGALRVRGDRGMGKAGGEEEEGNERLHRSTHEGWESVNVLHKPDHGIRLSDCKGGVHNDSRL